MIRKRLGRCRKLNFTHGRKHHLKVEVIWCNNLVVWMRCIKCKEKFAFRREDLWPVNHEK